MSLYRALYHCVQSHPMQSRWRHALLIPAIALAMVVMFAFTLVLPIGTWGQSQVFAQSTPEAEDGEGILVVLQPATPKNAATLQFWSPDAQLVHELPITTTNGTFSAPALSPDGRHWVAVRGMVNGPTKHGAPLHDELTLSVFRTSDGAEVASIPLLPADYPENIATTAALLIQGDPSLAPQKPLEEAVWAAFRYSLGIYEWSPDGTKLAFSSAADGPTSDLYLYDTQTLSITRLTDGIEQIDGIRWSPSGEWIWHSTISYGYCQVCAGHHYAAAIDGSEVITLPGSDIYRFITWLSDDTYLVTDQANGPGPFGLQQVDIATGESVMLWPGTHQGFIFDPANNQLAVIGTITSEYDPNVKVIVLDLETSEYVEYSDLGVAVEQKPWLAPLAQKPISYPCSRYHSTGIMVYPCVDTPFDALSPDGTYLVTEEFAVEKVEDSSEVLPAWDGLPKGLVLWRPDNLGYFTVQGKTILYRDLATGNSTEVTRARFLAWLPHANSDSLQVMEPTTSTPSK